MRLPSISLNLGLKHRKENKMNEYLLVIYDSRKRDYYNKIVNSTSKEMAAIEFMLLKKVDEVLLNVMDYG